MALTLGDAAAMALAFVLFVIVVGIGGSVLAGLRTGQFTTSVETAANCAANPTWVNCSTVASNATAQGLTGITNLSGQAGTIGTVIGAAILIGIVLTAFYFGKQGE
jgi:hypothetical protein